VTDLAEAQAELTRAYRLTDQAAREDAVSLAEARIKAVELRMQLTVYIADIRGRADRGGPQAYAYTYRQVADELERLLDG